MVEEGRAGATGEVRGGKTDGRRAAANNGMWSPSAGAIEPRGCLAGAGWRAGTCVERLWHCLALASSAPRRVTAASRARRQAAAHRSNHRHWVDEAFKEEAEDGDGDESTAHNEGEGLLQPSQPCEHGRTSAALPPKGQTLPAAPAGCARPAVRRCGGGDGGAPSTVQHKFPRAEHMPILLCRKARRVSLAPVACRLGATLADSELFQAAAGGGRSWPRRRAGGVITLEYSSCATYNSTWGHHPRPPPSCGAETAHWGGCLLQSLHLHGKVGIVEASPLPVLYSFRAGGTPFSASEIARGAGRHRMMPADLRGWWQRMLSEDPAGDEGSGEVSSGAWRAVCLEMNCLKDAAAARGRRARR